MDRTRTRNHEKGLRLVPRSERFERSSLDNFGKRGTLIREYKYWYLTKNEFPFENYKDQMILWSSSKMENEPVKHPMALQELADFIDEYTSNGYYVTIAWSARSSSRRFHLHVYKI